VIQKEHWRNSDQDKGQVGNEKKHHQEKGEEKMGNEEAGRLRMKSRKEDDVMMGWKRKRRVAQGD